MRNDRGSSRVRSLDQGSTTARIDLSSRKGKKLGMRSDRIQFDMNPQISSKCKSVLANCSPVATWTSLLPGQKVLMAFSTLEILPPR